MLSVFFSESFALTMTGFSLLGNDSTAKTSIFSLLVMLTSSRKADLVVSNSSTGVSTFSGSSCPQVIEFAISIKTSDVSALLKKI